MAHGRMRAVRAVVGVVAALFVGGTVAASGTALFFLRDLPPVEHLTSRDVSESTKIYDRTGTVLLYEISAGQKRTVVPLEDIPVALRNATIMVEDERFYTEPGFDWRGIIRAIIADIRHREKVQGASTITQQLARNAFLTPEKTFTRKIRELLLAVQITRRYPKDKILELYLNEVPYGPAFYGVEAAANGYFNKSVRDLSLAESAVLAALPRAPSYYSPWGSHTKELFERQRFILQKMRGAGRITEEEFAEAVAQKVVFQPQGRGILAPHFVIVVQDYLVQKYGEALVRSGGLRVVTTLDMDLQEIAEREVAEGAARNEQLYGGGNAALVAEDPRTGNILALVGSRDYFNTDQEGNFNAAMQGLRQPGSALKPFVYLTAFERGYTPDTVLFDVPTEFAAGVPACLPIPDYSRDTSPPCFHPKNFTETFLGPIKIRTALAQSVNIPAVKALYLAGLTDSLATLQRFGLTTLNDPSRYGLSLVLGGGEVRLIDLVGAYGALAQDGMLRPPSFVLEVRDTKGRLYESFVDGGERVADNHHVRTITSILSDETARRGLFGASFSLTVFPDQEVALKTGTSNDYRDAWAVGYTPTIVIGVWAGNNDNSPMHERGSSILAAVPIWSAVMKEALKTVDRRPFLRPETPHPSKPVFAGDFMSAGQPHTILFYVDRNDPLGPPPSDPSRDPQFFNWETAVTVWSVANPDAISAAASSSFGIRIKNPLSGTYVASNIPVWVRVKEPTPLERVTAFWNGIPAQEVPLASFVNDEVVFSLVPPSILQQNLLEIEARTADGKTSRAGVVLYGSEN